MAHLPLTEERQGEKGDSVTSSESYSYPCARGLYAPPGWGNGSHQSRFVERGERLNGRKVPDGWLRAANRLRHSERRAIAVWVRGLVAFFRSSLLVVHTAERGALLDRVRPEAIIAKIAVRHCRLGVLENGDRELRVTIDPVTAQCQVALVLVVRQPAASHQLQCQTAGVGEAAG